MRIFLVAVILGALTGIGGDPDCSHPAEEVCGGEDRTVCLHPDAPGDADDSHPGHEECPARHNCAHPCGHLLSYLPRIAGDMAVESSGEPYVVRLDRSPRTGFLAAPFHPPRTLS